MLFFDILGGIFRFIGFLIYVAFRILLFIITIFIALIGCAFGIPIFFFDD